MRTRLELTIVVVASLVCAGRAAEPSDSAQDLEAELLEKPSEPIQASLCIRAADVAHSHDALQHRADYSDQTRRHWQDGDTSGHGWGFTLSLRQHPGELTLRRERLQHDWDAEHEPNSSHEVNTKRDDWEILYWHTEYGTDDLGERGAWGWMVGVRYISSRKTLSIREGQARLAKADDVTWKLVHGGYWGVYRPAGWHARAFGSLGFFFGEVDGLAREGNDEERDGRIREQYLGDQGLAYGMNLCLGVGIDLLKYVRINFGYRREWLYSFQTTDSGVAVFPDNDDALFIENVSGLFAEIGARYQF